LHIVGGELRDGHTRVVNKLKSSVQHIADQKTQLCVVNVADQPTVGRQHHLALTRDLHGRDALQDRCVVDGRNVDGHAVHGCVAVAVHAAQLQQVGAIEVGITQIAERGQGRVDLRLCA
jgi:CTP:molybdopterin cytidylyltransferase MocA